MQNFRTGYVFVIILFSFVFSDCTYFHTVIDQKVLNNLDRYDQLYNDILETSKIGTRRIFRHPNELKQFNPELLDKKKHLAITKSDMLDDELIEEVRKEAVASLPDDLEISFISSVAGHGILELKDQLWKLIQD